MDSPATRHRRLTARSVEATPIQLPGQAYDRPRSSLRTTVASPIQTPMVQSFPGGATLTLTIPTNTGFSMSPRTMSPRTIPDVGPEQQEGDGSNSPTGSKRQPRRSLAGRPLPMDPPVDAKFMAGPGQYDVEKAARLTQTHVPGFRIVKPIEPMPVTERSAVKTDLYELLRAVEVEKREIKNTPALYTKPRETTVLSAQDKAIVDAQSVGKRRWKSLERPRTAASTRFSAGTGRTGFWWSSGLADLLADDSNVGPGSYTVKAPSSARAVVFSGPPRFAARAYKTVDSSVAPTFLIEQNAHVHQIESVPSTGHPPARDFVHENMNMTLVKRSPRTSTSPERPRSSSPEAGDVKLHRAAEKRQQLLDTAQAAKLEEYRKRQARLQQTLAKRWLINVALIARHLKISSGVLQTRYKIVSSLMMRADKFFLLRFFQAWARYRLVRRRQRAFFVLKRFLVRHRQHIKKFRKRHAAHVIIRFLVDNAQDSLFTHAIRKLTCAIRCVQQWLRMRYERTMALKLVSSRSHSKQAIDARKALLNLQWDKCAGELRQELAFTRMLDSIMTEHKLCKGTHQRSPVYAWSMPQFVFLLAHTDFAQPTARSAWTMDRGMSHGLDYYITRHVEQAAARAGVPDEEYAPLLSETPHLAARATVSRVRMTKVTSASYRTMEDAKAAADSTHNDVGEGELVSFASRTFWMSFVRDSYREYPRIPPRVRAEITQQSIWKRLKDHVRAQIKYRHDFDKWTLRLQDSRRLHVIKRMLDSNTISHGPPPRQPRLAALMDSDELRKLVIQTSMKHRPGSGPGDMTPE